MQIEVYADGNVKGKVECPKCGKAMALKVYSMAAVHVSNFWWEKEHCWYPNKRSKVNGEHRSEPYKSVLYCAKCKIDICVWRKDVEFSIVVDQECNQACLEDMKKDPAISPEQIEGFEACALEPDSGDVKVGRRRVKDKLSGLVLHGLGPISIVQLEGSMPDWPEMVSNYNNEGTTLVDGSSGTSLTAFVV